MTDARALGDLATAIWRDRVKLADQLVAGCKWSREEADRKLRPWVAICTLAGCYIEMLPSAAVSDYRAFRYPVAHWPGNGAPAKYDHDTGDAFARSHLASDWCSPLEWARALGEATNRAADRHTAEPCERSLKDWQQLATLSRALEVTVPWHEAAASAAHPERIAA